MSNLGKAAIQRERNDFKELLKYWRTVCGAFTGIFALLPIGGIFVEALLPGVLGLIAPPIAIFISIAVIVYFYYTNRDSERSQVGRQAKISFGVAIVCVIVFLCAWFSWVKQVDSEWHVTGLTLTAEARDAIAKRYVTNNTPKALLDRFGHQSDERIWEKRWVVQALMTVTFVAFFACVAGSFFLFVLQNLVVNSTGTPASPQAKR